MFKKYYFQQATLFFLLHLKTTKAMIKRSKIVAAAKDKTMMKNSVESEPSANVEFFALFRCRNDDGTKVSRT